MTGAAAGGREYVGKYRVLGELARGGMGVVYRALDENLGREIALKSPLADDASDGERRRLLQEGRATSRVSHPHVIPVYEVFEDHGRPWLAMELVEGQTLRDRLAAEGRLPVEELLVVGEQLADALAAAHARGVLHRDVKPSNIMLASRGDARLMDFGLASRLTDGSKASTHTVSEWQQNIAGTLGYISPEQILGRPLQASSDVFALGAVLYEAATGRRAFSGITSGELFDATLHLTPPPLGRELAREAPGELERIIFKALAKRPDERYQSAKELAADLRTLRRRLESQHVLQSVPQARLRPWHVYASAAIVVAGMAATWSWYSSRHLPSVQLGPPRQLTTESGWQAEPSISPDGTLVAYTSDEDGNSDIWLLDVNGVAKKLTNAPGVDRSPTWYPNGNELVFVSTRGGRASIWKVSKLGGPASLVIENADDPAISPDAQTIAFTRIDDSGLSRIHIAAVANPDVAQVLTNEKNGLWNHENPSWSPDGRTLVYSAARDLWTVTVAEHKATQLTTADAADANPVWAGDGFIYFSSNRDGSRALWRVPASGGAATRLTGGQGPEDQPSLSADGAKMVYSTFVDDTDLVLRDLASGRERRFGGARLEDQPVFSPDGTSIVFVSDRWIGRHDLWLQSFAADTNAPVGDPQRLTDQAGSVAQPAFSPDGKWIAYHHVLNGQRNIWIVSINGGPPIQFTSDPAMDVEPDWSPNGDHIVFVSNRSGGSQIWVAPVRNGRPAGPPRRLTTGPAVNGSPTWSSDGSLVAFVGGDGDVWIIEADGRSPARRVTSMGASARAERVAWDRSTGLLWANGFWGGGALSFRVVDVKNGKVRAPDKPIAVSVPYSSFDLSWDGKRMALARQELRGHLWEQQVRSAIP